MTSASKSLLTTLFFSLLALPVSAATISDISFTSNSGNFINDTILNGTSPLAFTATTDLAQPFLNSPVDSTVTLDYGSYYAISFLGFGEMLGDGTISFLLNGVTPFSQDVTFPDPTAAGPAFATFALPGNDSVTVSTTGLSADRIQIADDANGLNPDGTPDAFYLFNFTSGSGSATPEPASLAMFGAGLGVIFALRRRTSKRLGAN